MVLEYLIPTEEIEEEIKDYSSNMIKQKLISIDSSKILSIDMEGENLKTAKGLSKVHSEIMENNSYIILNNGCSEYFNKRLFPLINDFERKLRKLLYLVSAFQRNQNIQGIENVKSLEEKDLGKVFDLVFTDKNFNDEIRKKINKDITWSYTKKWIIEEINKNFVEITLWNQLFDDSLSIVSENYLVIKNCRNDVMHAHDMDYDNYLKTEELFTDVNNQIDEYIYKTLIKGKLSVEKIISFNENLSEGLKMQAESISSALKPLSEEMSILLQTINGLKEVLPNNNLKEITEILSSFTQELKSTKK